MIDSISSVNLMLMARPEHNQNLSEDHRSVVVNTLSNYDGRNLTADEKSKIRSTFRAEGIRPSSDLKGAVESVGFDSGEIRGNEETIGKSPPLTKFTSYEKSVTSILEILVDYEDATLSPNSLAEIKTKWLELGGNQNSTNYVSFDI